MFRLFNNSFDKPAISIEIKGDELQFSTGMIVEKMSDGSYGFSDGNAPFGIIDVQFRPSSTVLVTMVWPFDGSNPLKVFATDLFIYPNSFEYKINDPVYVSKGKLTMVKNGKEIGKLAFMSNEWIKVIVNNGPQYIMSKALE